MQVKIWQLQLIKQYGVGFINYDIYIMEHRVAIKNQCRSCLSEQVLRIIYLRITWDAFQNADLWSSSQIFELDSESEGPQDLYFPHPPKCVGHLKTFKNRVNS